LRSKDAIYSNYAVFSGNSASNCLHQEVKVQPDVFLVGAKGLVHPNRCGFASHLGLALEKPTVRAAKSRLIGLPVEKNGRIFLFDKCEVVGEAVETKPDAKPVYVSIGHMVSLETAVKIVKNSSKGRIPEPLLQAHNIATKQRKSLPTKAK
jgi:deoxyribonuclease V